MTLIKEAVTIHLCRKIFEHSQTQKKKHLLGSSNTFGHFLVGAQNKAQIFTALAAEC